MDWIMSRLSLQGERVVMQSRLRNLLSKRGFTLIELMTVVAVIGILAAIAIPNYIGYRNRAHYASLQVTLRHLMDAQDKYFLAKNEFYPPTGNINIRYGRAGSVKELGFSVGDGHLHRYRFRGVNNARDNRYIIDVWSDIDFNKDGRKDRFRCTTWYRDGEIFRDYHRYVRQWN